VRFKWLQNGSGGAFYIKVFEDDGGMPGAEVYSAVQASGNLDGWNEKDLSAQGLNVSLVPIQKSPETFSPCAERSFSFHPSKLPEA
jgi:hypothetical protein